MRSVLGLVALAALATLACGGNSSSPPPATGEITLDRDAIFVTNTGSTSISAFQLVGPMTGPAADPVSGSPFQMSAPPTALGGGILFDMGLLVLSQPQKSISMYSVSYQTGVLTGPSFTITTNYTPVAVAGWRSFFYVANAEGSVSAYQVSGDGTVVTELEGSPFPAGSGPAAIAAADQPGLLYVANSQSNNISGYSLDTSTGVPTPLAGSPYPSGDGPASVVVDPAAAPNPSGPRVVIVPNRLSNNVSVFSVAGDGSLSPVPGSPFPAGGAPSSAATNQVMPLSFAYVSNPESNDVAGYSIDGASGALTPLPGSPFSAGTRPASVAMEAGGNFVYVVNAGSNSLSVFASDPETGALTPVSGSPFPVGQSPGAVLYFQVPQ
jgi:6-phosphogluconolactonase (cycloisomerase 2 family)